MNDSTSITPTRPYENHLVVLSEEGLPPSTEWTRELQYMGLDIEVHPARHHYSVHDCLVPMSVRGHLAPVGLDTANNIHYDWFPPEIPRLHAPEAFMLVFSPKGICKALWEQAAYWAAAASLVVLRYATLFDKGGVRNDPPELCYERARALMAKLNSQPHPDPGDPTLDLRSDFARQYDERHG